MSEIHGAVAMADHFDKIQKLPDPLDGVPNFRCVPGYQVYCCGQPTAAGFENALSKVKGGKVVWVNMRQEPVVYVNGNPLCARPPNKIGEYAELGNVTAESVSKDEMEFVKLFRPNSLTMLPQTSRPTSVKSFTIFLESPIRSSPTCLMWEITKSVLSTGLLPRL